MQIQKHGRVIYISNSIFYIHIYIYLGALITFPPLSTIAALRVDLEAVKTVEGAAACNEILYLLCIISIAAVGYTAQLASLCFRILWRETRLVARLADERCFVCFMVVYFLRIPSARRK